MSKDIISPIFEHYKIKKVFCTQYCTFFLTRIDKIIQIMTNFMAVGSTTEVS